MKSGHTAFFVLLLYFLLQSCQIEDNAPSEPNTFPDIFESFWLNMNRNYVYWDIDTTDWDDIYKEYKPKFAVLERSSIEDMRKSVAYFEDMTKTLIDGHFEINFVPNEISNFRINPLYNRKRANDTLYSFSYLLNDTIYLDSNFKLGYDHVNVKHNSPLIAVCGLIQDQIIYFSCNYFGITNSYYKNPNGGIRETLNYFIDLVNDEKREYKGVIIDVRNNPGGDVVDLGFILGNLIDRPLHIGYSQYKRGYGRLEYTDWIETYILPNPNQTTDNIPVTVLADRNSASLAETVVMSIKAMPNGTFLGEKTWGASGPIVDHDIYIGGSFEVGTFMKVRMSTCKVKSIEHTIFEGVGINPDIYIPHSIDDYSVGRDTQLEKALELLLK